MTARAPLDATTLAWVDSCLRRAGRTRTGPPALRRERSWASVVEVPTDGGPAWAKLPAGADLAEATAYAVLRDVAPDRVLAPLGLDRARGRLLLPDGGQPLDDRLAGAELTAAMAAALRAYARVQQAAAARVDDLIAGGVPDMRPERMPERLAGLLAALRPWVDEHADADRRARFDLLHDLRPRYAQWCAQLADAPRGASIDHNDLHPRNVIGSPAWPVFWDWGDCVVAHPFAGLLFALETAPAEDRTALRDAYLGEYGDPAALRDEADLAVRVAQVARALVWQRALAGAGPDHPHASAPMEHLLRLLV